MSVAELTSQRVTRHAGVTVTSDTAAYPSNVTAGNLLIVAGAMWQNETTATVSGSDGTSFTVLVNSTAIGGGASGTRSFLAYGLATGGACTVTVTPDAQCYLSFTMTEFSGVKNPPLDTSTENLYYNGGVSAPFVISITTKNGPVSIAYDCPPISPYAFQSWGAILASFLPTSGRDVLVVAVESTNDASVAGGSVTAASPFVRIGEGNNILG